VQRARPAAWQFAGIGDYNGDGVSDVLWRNTATGEVDTWLVNDGHKVGGGAIGEVSTAWTSSASDSAAAATTHSQLATFAVAAPSELPGADELSMNALVAPFSDRISPSIPDVLFASDRTGAPGTDPNTHALAAPALFHSFSG
jgi:hypothetical protein